MNYSVDKGQGEPAYWQLYERLKRDIVAGVLPQGSKLPSKRLLAEQTGLSVITVEHAYALLVDEGYAESRPRSGFYAAFGQKQPPVVLKARPDPATITQAPEDFPFSLWTRTMRQVISEYDRRILTRSPSRGMPELKEELSAYLLRSRGLAVHPDQIIIGAGAEYLYGLVVQLLGRDKTYALEDPCYEKIEHVYQANGAATEKLEMGTDGIVSARLRDCAAGVLHVTPFHSFPSGVTASASKRHEYAAWARTRNAVIVEDDYDSEFASPTKRIETICSLAPERVIYINTFTKILAPSMRTGFMVLPEEKMSSFEERLGFYSCTVPVFEQLVLAEFIRRGHLERYINRRRRKGQS